MTYIILLENRSVLFSGLTSYLVDRQAAIGLKTKTKPYEKLA